MRSILLLGLFGHAVNVHAHPAFHHANPKPKAYLSRRTVDLNNFRLPQTAHYTNAPETSSDPVISLFKRETYVETATDLVKTVAPGTTFRIVEDHYIGANGIAHVNFKQTAHGLDIDNADFNVNVYTPGYRAVKSTANRTQIGRDGKVFSFGNNFFTGEIPTTNPLRKRDFKDPVEALQGAASMLQLPVEAAGASAVATGIEVYSLKGTSGAVRDPEAKLMYLVKPDGSLALTWRVETDIMENWLLTYVDAVTSQEVYGVIDYVADLATYNV